MAINSSLTLDLDKLKDGDERAAWELWERFSKRLTRVARKKLGNMPRRVEDEEDVVQSALQSFFHGIRAGGFPKLRGQDNLWPLLCTITERKAINQRHRQLALKRGSGQVRGDSVFSDTREDSQFEGLDQLEAPEPTHESMIEFTDRCQHLLGVLHDDRLQTVATMKLQGYTNSEIAQRLAVTERTVERKLHLIRRQWSDVLET